MRKLLALTLAGIFVLGACGGNDDDKSSSQNKSYEKEEKADKKESNNKDTNNNQYENSANDQSTTNERITPEKAEQIAYNKYKSVYPREYFKYDSERSSNTQYKVSFPWKDATGYPIQSLAIIDSSSGEIVTVKNDNSEDEERKRAENHLRTSLVVNKLDDDIIKKYKPNEYNKIKKYANQHPNAFSEKGGIDNQQKVDEILGYNNTSNSKNDEKNTNSSNENKNKSNPSNQEEPNKAPNNSEDTNDKQNNNNDTTAEDDDKENKNEPPNSNKDTQEDSQQENANQNDSQQSDSTQEIENSADENN
ncbi:hypothetical protein [Staphylococcus argensis]|uniref:PepSY domain-containing protein n=1 Tax=Staphylococcus argensis TaxID=1607738 RepID=A0A2K4FDL8_9STAP|nr:hypothetical protein [Staphylococcus argensis]MCY6991241.1 hypothetical protein [Staphylococcus argensis]POA09450.1 hypothetical protein CD039_01430 [Staphylococcus argensis]